jgi:hypothetical protein
MHGGQWPYDDPFREIYNLGTTIKSIGSFEKHMLLLHLEEVDLMIGMVS